MRECSYTGLLCIGDPHLASRVPGFRKDDYPRTILGKLEWSLRYAEENRLLPVLLGDLFHWPRDNANWLLVELIDLFDCELLAVSGNHDCNENTLTPDDTLSVLVAGGHLRLIDQSSAWTGAINDTPVLIAGTPWGQSLPKSFKYPGPDAHGSSPAPLVFWISHHDLRFPGYEDSARTDCRELAGVDVVINGHIHRPLQDVVCGRTTWLNPGNIARVSRGDASRGRKPSVLRIDIRDGRWTKLAVEIPHQPFEEVFYPELVEQAAAVDESIFIRGLAQLQSLKTAGGAGLRTFLDENLSQFESSVAAEVRRLADEVLTHEHSSENNPGH